MIRSTILGLMLGSASLQAGAAAYDDFVNAINSDNAREVVQLLRRGIDANTVDPRGQPVLHTAARAGALEVVKALLNAGAEIDRRNPSGETAVMIASLNGRRSVVEWMLGKEAQINHPGWTPLIYAATNGHREIVALLLEHHAYIDSAPPNGITALMMAARGGHMEVVKLLLEEGADATLKNDRGESAQDWALATKNTDIAALIKSKIKG
jgi:ankyrin repeat protein